MRYQVTAKRGGDRWWSIEVTGGLPDGHAVFSQARSLGDVENMARSAIVDTLDVAPSAVDIDVEVSLSKALRRQVDALNTAKAMEASAVDRLRAARCEAVVGITDEMTQRDAAALLGISHQRVKQILDEARNDEAAAA